MQAKSKAALGLALAGAVVAQGTGKAQAADGAANADKPIVIAQAQPQPPANQDPKQKAAQQAEAERRAKAEQARNKAEAERRARQDQMRQQQEQRRQQVDRANADRQKAEAERRAKAEQDRNRMQAEREKIHAERQKLEADRRAKAEQDRKHLLDERAKVQAERQKAEADRRAKAEQDRLKAQADRARVPDAAPTSRQTPPGDPARGPSAPVGTAAGGQPPASKFVGAGKPIRDNLKLDDIKKQRTEVREADGKRVVISEPGGRKIVRENNRAVVVGTDSNRLRWNAQDVKSSAGAGGTRVTTVTRPGGVTIVTTEDANGRVLRRSRRDASGRERVFFQNRPSGWALAAIAVAVAIPTIAIARHLYEVPAREARYDDFYTAFRAEPVSRLDRVYTLDEVRYSYPLRAHMRSVDVDTITFATGSWDIEPSQFRKLQAIADAIDATLRDNPDELYLIEGHTDAVGRPEDNLTLSDRRAESVARVLTEEFGIPPENLTTQGYGSEFLKVPTSESDSRNRRVVIRRITPLVSENYRR